MGDERELRGETERNDTGVTPSGQTDCDTRRRTRHRHATAYLNSVSDQRAPPATRPRAAAAGGREYAFYPTLGLGAGRGSAHTARSLP